MGCDIHLYAEVKDAEGNWKNYDYRDECVERDDNGKPIYEVYTGEEFVKTSDLEEVAKYNSEDVSKKINYDKLFKHPLEVGRNYDLFAILANVRNGYGFAGCDTGDGFIPIDEPRGLPGDVTDDVKKESDGWGINGHSHSWFTLRELLEYNWDKQVTEHRGVVSAEEYIAWKEKGGCPESWCGDISGRDVKHLTNSEMDRAIAEGNTEHCYTSVSWKETYGESVSHFTENTIPALRKLVQPEDPDAVRIVFWFDS